LSTLVRLAVSYHICTEVWWHLHECFFENYALTLLKRRITHPRLLFIIIPIHCVLRCRHLSKILSWERKAWWKIGADCLLSCSVKVITVSLLILTSLDIGKGWPNKYWRSSLGKLQPIFSKTMSTENCQKVCY
jgi:hypothetical protein